MTIDIANQQDIAPIDEDGIRTLCSQTLRRHQTGSSLSICYVDDRAIQVLNARYLDRDESTDVLAFPLDDDLDGDEPLLGEIVVSAETAAREAQARGIPIEREIALYTAHGLLHLLGYDDHEPDDTARMRDAERQALEEAGLT
jgi:probable rRNA maturation factor